MCYRYTPMNDPTYPLFPVFAFLGFIVALIPFPWHLQAWNAGTCVYMIWAGLASLIQFVNSIIWKGNTEDVAPVWCDIGKPFTTHHDIISFSFILDRHVSSSYEATKFVIGAGVGIPASSLCINRRLYRIASIQSVGITRNEVC